MIIMIDIMIFCNIAPHRFPHLKSFGIQALLSPNEHLSSLFSNIILHHGV